jgi:hypothetical protein
VVAVVLGRSVAGPDGAGPSTTYWFGLEDRHLDDPAAFDAIIE